MFKFKSYSDASFALQVARSLYEEADREYRQYYGVFGDLTGDAHGRFLEKRLRSRYNNLQKTMAKIRKSGYTQMVTDYLIHPY